MIIKRNIFIKTFFIIIEIVLLFLLVFLSFKIYFLEKGSVKGVQYITRINPTDVIFSSTSGLLKYFYEPKANSVENYNPEWLGYVVINSINNDSFNERYNYSVEKSENTYRIITLGDSFTFGQFVNTAENYTELLEDKLNNQLECDTINKFEVINLGVWGYDIEYGIQRFTKRGIKYNPDLVVWLINSGNFMKINEYKLPLEEKLKKEGMPNFDPIEKKYSASEKAKALLKDQFGLDNIINYQKTALSHFPAIYKNNLLVATFANFPVEYKYKVIDFVSRNNQYFYYDNLLGKDADNKILRLIDGHPNREGHQRIAEDIFAFIVRKYLAECKELNN